MQALLVAHGQPSDPAPQEAAMAGLAARVQALLPGWAVRGATLAAPGALEATLAGLERPLVLPFFMAEGWFTRTLLPRRLAAAGARLAPLPAFGAAPELPALAARAALEGAAAAGLAPADTTLLLAAHGSKVARASAEAAQAMAAHLRQATPFRAVTAGFIEEAPHVQDAARGLHPALCLPLFALRASHVAQDLPRALAAAGFAGPLLPALGEHAGVPALIAAALRRAVP